MELRQVFMTRNPCYRNNINKADGRYVTFQQRGPVGFMLHSIGCPQPSAMVLINSWNREDYGTACVHGFIDANTGVAYQTLPWNFRGWHGGSPANDTHIGVEMCEPACIRYTQGATFTCSNFAEARAAATRTYKTAVELFAHLCTLYGKDPLADGVILSHKEGHARGIATNHGDPEHLWRQLELDYTMDRFRADVKRTIEKAREKEEEAMAKIYKDIQDVPAYWRGDMQELLDLGCVNGGTPADVCDTDLNLSEDCVKAVVIIKSYVDAKYGGPKGGAV